MARIEFKNLGHSYNPGQGADTEYALQPLQHTWRDGGAYSLLGPSGCGKTTLLNITSGLLAPSEGQVLFDGKDVTALSPQQRNIAQVFQFPVIYDTMTVFDNLAFPLRNRGDDKTTIRKRVEAVAEMLELTRMLPRRARNLGADEKQLISMGRGLVRDDVSAILFDEPLTVIDPHLKWVLRRKLKEVHAQFGHTLIYVTHDQIEALTFAEEVVVMKDGAILQAGTPEELFKAPRHTFVGYFIGSPGMNLAPCRLDGNHAFMDGVSIPLDEALAQRAAGAEGTMELGIRPELLQLTNDPDGIVARVEQVQDRGNAKLYTALVGEHRFNITAPEDHAAQQGDTVGLHFPPAATHLYCNGQLVE